LPKQPIELTVERRKEIFAAVIDVQDRGTDPVESRVKVARKFRVSVADVQKIEEEGLNQEWPPLEP